jgi:hypothetical protein
MKYYDDGEGPDDARDLPGWQSDMNTADDIFDFALAAAEAEFDKDCHIDFPRDIFVVMDSGEIWCCRIDIELNPTFVLNDSDLVQKA